MTITVRPVTNDDEPSWRELWRAYLEFYGTSKPEEVYALTWARILDPAEDMHCHLAFKDGVAIGLVDFLYHRSFWDIENRCYLNDLYTSPTARGTGAATALIEAVVSHAKGQNCAQVYWLTAQDNVQARRLYDKVASLTPFVKYQV